MGEVQKVNPERAKMIKDLQDEKAKYEAELRADPTDPAAKMNLKQVNGALKRYGVNIQEDNSKMKDGGMAKGKGGKMYQHNYATGGSVTDHLSRVVGPQMGQPQSVQAMTATVGETPAERSKRLRSGG
jgi:hypothetical protein